VGLVAFFVGVTGLTWPPHVLGSVILGALGALFGPNAEQALRERQEKK
jgi:hypothetical protein